MEGKGNTKTPGKKRLFGYGNDTEQCSPTNLSYDELVTLNCSVLDGFLSDGFYSARRAGNEFRTLIQGGLHARISFKFYKAKMILVIEGRVGTVAGQPRPPVSRVEAEAGTPGSSIAYPFYRSGDIFVKPEVTITSYKPAKTKTVQRAISSNIKVTDVAYQDVLTGEKRVVGSLEFLTHFRPVLNCLEGIRLKPQRFLLVDINDKMISGSAGFRSLLQILINNSPELWGNEILILCESWRLPPDDFVEVATVLQLVRLPGEVNFVNCRTSVALIQALDRTLQRYVPECASHAAATRSVRTRN